MSPYRRKGLVLIVILCFVLLLSMVAAFFLLMSSSEVKMVRQQSNSIRAFYIAEAGIAQAIAQLEEDWNNDSPLTDVPFGEGTFSVTFYDTYADGTPLPNYKLRVRSVGTLADVLRTVEVIVSSSSRFGSPNGVTSAIETEGLLDVRGAVDINGDIRERVEASITSQANIGDTIVQLDDVSNLRVGARVAIDIGTAQEEEAVVNFVDSSGSSITLEEGLSSSHATGTGVERVLSFQDIFGVDKEEIEDIATENYPATYYDTAFDNDVATELTWVISADESQITKDGWTGDGILIVNGDLKITGGTFSGVIWVIGELSMSGNPVINGGIFVESGVTIDTAVTGTVTINYDADAIGDAFSLLSSMGPQIESWQEAFD